MATLPMQFLDNAAAVPVLHRQGRRRQDFAGLRHCGGSGRSGPARAAGVSTDPASNVGQVFGIEIGNRVTTVDAVPGLAALEIDPQAAAQLYRDQIVGPVRGVLPDAVVRSIEEQLSGACTTEIAAFDEFTALLTDPALRRCLRPHRVRHRADRPHDPPAATAGRVEMVSWRTARAMRPAWARWPGWKSSAPSIMRRSRRWPIRCARA